MLLGYTVKHNRKMLPKCTLGTNSTQIIVSTELDKEKRLYDERIYCAKSVEEKTQVEGMEVCKSLQAKLPLPISVEEVKAFWNYIRVQFDDFQLLIGIRDPEQTKLKKNWKDIEGKNAAYVNLRVKLFIYLKLMKK